MQDYLNAYHATFTAPAMLPYLRIRGTPDYWAELDSEIRRRSVAARRRRRR